MRLFFKRLFSLMLFVAVLFLVWYFFQDRVERQLKKVKGVYYIYKGDQAYSQDNMSKTLEYYKRGLSLYPGHYEAWFNLGNIYAVYEDYYSAVDAYKNAIKHNPKFVMARMNLGIVYSEDLGFFDEAIEQFDIIPDIKLFQLWIPFVYSNVKSIKGNRGIAHYNKGVAFKRKAMFLPLEKKHQAYQLLGEAVDAYNDAAKILKKNYDVYYNRAVAHHLRGEYKKAGADYCKAIELQPMKFEGHYNLAVLLNHTKHYGASRDELEKAARLITESADESGLQTAYIFNLLNEVSRKFMTSGEYGSEKLSNAPVGNGYVTYINGKIVDEKEFDRAMLRNFKTCAGFETFKQDEEEDF